MNSPMYDDKGRRVAWAEAWRIPSRPFAPPTCCKRESKRIGRNSYRCMQCWARLWPERLWHRLMFKLNPFGSSGLRHLLRTTKLAPIPTPQ